MFIEALLLRKALKFSSPIRCSSKYVCNLSEKDKKFAKIRLNETDEIREERIRKIRQWLLDTPGMTSRTDDFYILRFLRDCKFDIDKTKIKIRNFLKIKADCPQWFANRDPFRREMQEILNLGVYLPLRAVDKQNRTVVIERFNLHDPNKHSTDSIMKVGMTITDLLMRDNESMTLYGTAVIVDLEGLALSHALQASPNVMKNLIHATYECYPVEVKSYDFVNVPCHLSFVIEIVKTLMSEDKGNRFFIHSDDRVLVQKFPKEILPVEYGGTDGSIDSLKDYWKKQVERNRDWIIDDEKYKLMK